jgi:flagellar biogenesis protein FliO
MDASQEAWLLLRSFAALAAVVALAFVTLRFGLPWLMRQRGEGRPRQLLVEEYYPLDRSHRLYVVRWEAQRLLIATSPERVELIARAGAAEPFADVLDRRKAKADDEAGGEG